MNNPQHQPTQAKGENKDAKINLDRIESGLNALVYEVKSDREQRNNDKWPKRVAVAAIIYTIITALIFCITGYQAYLSKIALISVQRAFIFAYVPTFYTLFENQELKYRIRPNWRNSGTTPAISATLAFQCAYANPKDSQPDFIYPATSVSENNIIAPQNTEASFNIDVEQNIIKDVVSKKIRMFCYGFSAYRDVFDYKRTTRFCFEFNEFEFTGPNSLNGTVWKPCPRRYACTDDQCKNSH